MNNYNKKFIGLNIILLITAVLHWAVVFFICLATYKFPSIAVQPDLAVVFVIWYVFAAIAADAVWLFILLKNKKPFKKPLRILLMVLTCALFAAAVYGVYVDLRATFYIAYQFPVLGAILVLYAMIGLIVHAVRRRRRTA